MTYELKDDTGSLWKNDRREKETQPNARGQAKIDGVVFWVDAWTNETRDGTKYQSLKFKRKEEQPSNVQRIADNITPPADLDDDLDSVPF